MAYSYYEGSEVFDEGLGGHGPGGYGSFSGGLQNYGGVADAWSPHGQQSIWGGYVVSGGNFIQGYVSSGGPQTNPAAAHYYQGYWAGVQGALYGFGPPEAPPVHSYGFAIDVLQALEQPPTQDLKARVSAAAGALGHVSHPFELWLIPSASGTDWYLGSGANGDWPVDLPDWGDRPPGPLPPMPGFSPIKGRAYDIFSFVIPDEPTEQEIQDAGNPALWLLPSAVGPMENSISTPAQEPVYIAPGFPPPPTTSTLIPFDITPGNTISDVTPRGDWTE